MILSTLAIAFTLITQSLSQLAEDPYWVGSGYDLSWSTGGLNSKKVDIVLYYGTDLKSNWTIAKNVDNTGTSQSITVGTDISNTVTQLLIANGTMGQFRAELPLLNQTNMTTNAANLSTVIPIYQTVYFETTGAAINAGERYELSSVVVYVRRDTYTSMGSPQFVASFVSVNEDGMTWSSANETVGIHTEGQQTTTPTMRPTLAPTTSTPTTSTPTTTMPTTATPTTATPTTATPTTATPTTATPTTSTPTTATPTTATPTTATPTTATPTTSTPTTATPTTATPTTSTPTTATPTTSTPTTATPTTATPTTATPTTATPTTTTPTTSTPTTSTPTTSTPTTSTPTTTTPTTSTPTTSIPTTTATPTTFVPTPRPSFLGRRLLSEETMSLREVTLGLENDDSESYGIGGTCDSRTKETWCTFNLTVNVQDTSTTGGPYILNIGLMDADAPNSTLQYYAINGNDMAGEVFNQYLFYNDSNIDIGLFDSDGDAVNWTFSKYDRIGMQVDVGEELKDIDLFVTLERLEKSDTYYYLECGAHPADYYTAFGWKTYDYVGLNTTLPRGTYQFQLYWGAYENFLLTQVAGRYQIDAVLPYYLITPNDNGTQTSAVTIKDNKLKYSRGTTSSVDFYTSFNNGTELYGYIEQCDYTNSTKGKCTNYQNESSFEFTYGAKGPKSVDITFPSALYDTSSSSNSKKQTLMHVSTMLCDGETELETIIELDISKESKSKSDSLSAGAIVGIVCAGVLVLGLAAWWLCMKKGSGDGYRELNE